MQTDFLKIRSDILGYVQICKQAKDPSSVAHFKLHKNETQREKNKENMKKG